MTIDRGGLIYPAFMRGQLEKLGLPLEICFSFVKDTAKMLPNILQNQVKKNIWNKYSTLADLKPVYGLFMDRVEKYTDEILVEIQKRT